MMNSLQQLVANTDIYLIDQILKGRYLPTDNILDADCGSGRNLHWFLQEGFPIFGVDNDAETIALLQEGMAPAVAARFCCAAVEKMPFPNNFFAHVISSAVLHFATGEAHFMAMMTEMVRVLQPGGSLFIRMTSNAGIENLVRPVGNGAYLIPDGSLRFLLTPELLEKALRQCGLILIEPFKTVLVNDERSMCTVVAVRE